MFNELNLVRSVKIEVCEEYKKMDKIRQVDKKGNKN